MTTPADKSTLPVAVVTGATGGMGRDIVADLVADHRVFALGRNEATLAQLRELANVTAIAADLTDLDTGFPPELTGLEVNVLIHAAAVASRSSVADADHGEWRRQLDLNVLVPALLTRHLLPGLRTRRGTVVFINSGAGLHGIGGNAVYATTKHALRGLADSLRQEVATDGVRVTTIYPGPTDTPMLEGLMAQAGTDYRPEWYIEPAEVTRAVRLAVDAGETTQLTDIAVRPRVELSQRK
ncbi:SDR family oxidoreductase [Corynebacterium ulceribovis]|uniref:SDR family oxidoreductase n=1 Tax=Corynebacterium ulceribovis TaxID=487732 RepID=UPI00039C9CD5|nr:SDR family oxidoreductase [Corynebacterium ulceribovis]